VGLADTHRPGAEHSCAARSHRPGGSVDAQGLPIPLLSWPLVILKAPMGCGKTEASPRPWHPSRDGVPILHAASQWLGQGTPPKGGGALVACGLVDERLQGVVADRFLVLASAPVAGMVERWVP